MRELIACNVPAEVFQSDCHALYSRHQSRRRQKKFFGGTLKSLPLHVFHENSNVRNGTDDMKFFMQWRMGVALEKNGEIVL